MPNPPRTGRRIPRAALAAMAMLLAALEATAVAAEGDHVTLFARLDAAIERVDVDAPTAHPPSQNRVSNYRTIFGVFGEEKLTQDVRLVWQLSAAFPVDLPLPGFPLRDSRVGVTSPAGTLFLGAWLTPYSLAVLRLDPYVLTTADMSTIVGNGNAPVSGNLDNTFSFIRRQGNSVNYISPDWNGLQARIAYGADEERTAQRDPWLLSASIGWDSKETYIAVAFETHNDYQAAATRDRGMLATVERRFFGGATRIGVAWERIRYETLTGALQRDALFVAFSQRVGPGVVQATYNRAGHGSGASTQLIGGVRAGTATSARIANLGYEYSFSRRTQLQVFASRLANDDRAAYEFGANSPGRVAGATVRLFALGMRHSF